MNLKKINNREFYLVVLLFFIGLAMHVLGPDDALDIKFFYTSTQANHLLQGLSAFQTRAYLLNEILDLFFLTTYSLIFFLLTRRFYFRKAWLAFIPGIFDLIETTTIIFLLLNPKWSSPPWLGSISCLKWSTGFAVGTFILVGFARRSKQPHGPAT